MNEVMDFILSNELIFIPIFLLIEGLLLIIFGYSIFIWLCDRDNIRLAEAKRLCQKHHVRD